MSLSLALLTTPKSAGLVSNLSRNDVTRTHKDTITTTHLTAEISDVCSFTLGNLSLTIPITRSRLSLPLQLRIQNT